MQPNNYKSLKFWVRYLSLLLLLSWQLMAQAQAANSIAGQVFEDVNYSGGGGRSISTASGKGVNGAKVELYNGTGSLVSSATTANDGVNNGAYSFTGLAPDTYYVRVVNSTVKSTRTGTNGTERGVQTFRTDGTTDTTNEVGGRNPNIADAGANTGSETLNTATFSLSTSGKVQSVQPVTITSANFTGVGFGFNFDTIVNTNDNGQGSLRQFILNSNLLGNTGLAQSGLTAGLENSIFQIPGTGPFTISPSSALPAITDSYTAVNASTQSGSSCAESGRTLMIAINGTSAGSNSAGLTINAANALVKGLAIGNFTDTGISANSAASNLSVKCNNLGLNTDGTSAMQNGTFGLFDNAGANLTVGGTSVDDRNIISNNFKDGIKLNSVNTALIQNNYIGTSADGLSSKSNNQEAADQAGILLTGTSAAPSKTITVTGNVIAGNNKANTALNANNTTKGIRLSYANFVTITNNKIGTTPDGMTALANTGYGIYTINSTDITIGGTTAADRNIISGNNQDGINTRSGTNRISILGNYIGLGSDGIKAIGNANNGIFLADTSNATIGNSSASGRNIIGSNSYSGIRNSTSTGTKITDNYVGTDVSGTLDRGNTLHGVYVNNANDVVVGGSTAADGNLIVYNKVIGVFTDKTATNNTNTLVENNYVGMLKDGETTAGNTQAGVETKNNVGVTIRNNLISGNKTRGIHLVNSPNTTITNNRIGTNANGTSDKGNLNHGIDVETAAANLLVDNNVISGNDQSGIRLINGDATGSVISNNRIGTSQDGNSAIANTLDGITVDNVPNFTIGSTTSTGNTLSGNNRHGIVIANASTKNVSVVGNLIGLNSAGTAALGNASQGIMVQNGATAIKIGDGTAAGSNKIARNGDNGIILSGSTTNDVSISQNSIYANTNLGIDINLDKVSINDANDTDTGPNAVLNFPLIKSASLNAGNLTLSGCAPTGATLEFYEADVSPTSSSGVSAGANKTTLTQDYGEGEQFITRLTEGVGEDTQTTPLDCASLVGADGNSAVGMSPFQWTITTPSTLISGDKVTATATVTGTGTSEFSGVASALNPIDYADAPASYGSPSHNIVSGIYLGSNIDADAGVFASTDATGDDITDNDDEDGIGSIPNFMQGYTASLAVKTTGAGGYLQAWVDWNQNGVFDAGEQVLKNVQDGSAFDTDNTANGAIGFYVTVPDTAKSGQTFLRLRWSTSTNLDATSVATNGEVEDYQITISSLTDGKCSGYSAVVYDPNTTNTETNYDGWQNNYDTNAIGSFPYKVFEKTPQWISIDGMDWKFGSKITDGVGDDTGYMGYKLTDADWDRSIAFTHIMAAGEGGNYKFTLTWGDDHIKIFKNNVQIAGLQNAYGSTPNETPYVVLDNYPLAVGDKLTVVVTEEHNYNTAVKLQVTPLFPSPCAPSDQGDIPASYEPTTKAFHVINSDVYLGSSAPDSETEPSVPLNGTGDDVTGSDDDDAIVLPTLQQGKRTEFEVKVHGTGGYLQGWIDWSGDGDFDDTVGGRSERIALNYQDGVLISTHGSHGDLDQNVNGVIRFQVLPPANATTNPTYLRLRWSTTKDLDVTTPASDGEVEDYALSIQANTFPSYGMGTQATCSASNQRQLLLDPEFDSANGSGGWANWTVTSNPSNPPYPWRSDQRTGYASIWMDTGTSTLSQTNLSGWNRGPSSYGGAKLQLDLFWADASNGLLGANSLSQAVTLEVRIGTTLYATLTTSPSYDFTQAAAITYYNGATGNLSSLLGKGESSSVIGTATPSTWIIELPDTAVATGDFNLRLDADPADSANGDDILIDSASAWICNEDYSDAPISYGDSYHTINTAYSLGTLNTAETSSPHNVAADTGDDGVTLPTLTQGELAVVNVAVKGTGGYLQGWIDWNGDGDFNDIVSGRSEQIAKNFQDGKVTPLSRPTDGDLDASVNGTISFYALVPADATTHPTYARFRWSTTPNLDTTTPASDGEVEDYTVTIAARSATPVYNTGTAATCTAGTTQDIIRNGHFNTTSGSAWTDWVVTKNTTHSYFWRSDLRPSYASTYIDIGDTTLTQTGLSGWNMGPGSLGGALVTVNLYWAEGIDVSTASVSEPGLLQLSVGGVVYASLITSPHYDTTQSAVVTYSNGATGNLNFLPAAGEFNAVKSTGTPSTWIIELPKTVAASGDLSLKFSVSPIVTVSGTPTDDMFVDSVSASVCKAHTISGRVFEDMNYGGGAGRDFTTAAGKGVNGVTVELYKADGSYVGTTTTANDGSNDGVYSFNQVLDGNYYVRVVSETVNSTRTGSTGAELGIQTFRTDGTTAVTNEVGGHNPSLADGVANTGTETLDTANYKLSGGAIVQNLQPITMAGADLSGVEFGFNFDTIVNTNDSGQGSLRQFIANANLLDNTGLDQAANSVFNPAAGLETSIFMIPNSQLTSSGANNGAAVITLTSPITSTADNTAIDARTQTANIGNTNAGQIGTGGKVGVDAITLDKIERPEVVVKATGGVAFNFNGNNGVLHGIAGYGASIGSANYIILNKTSVVEGNLIGALADGSAPDNSEQNDYISLRVNAASTLTNNFFAYSPYAILTTSSTAAEIRNNEFAYLGSIYGNYRQDGDGISIQSPATVTANLFRDMQGAYDASGGSYLEVLGLTTASNNTFIGAQRSAVRLLTNSVNSLITKNIMTGSVNGSGVEAIAANATAANGTLKQNSIYANHTIGIDLGSNGVSLNDANDADTGVNNLLNFPQFKYVAISDTGFMLEGCAPAGSTVELFKADVSPSSTSGVAVGANKVGKLQDYGEGEVYLESFTMPATGTACSLSNDIDGNNSSGMLRFSYPISTYPNLSVGDYVTATATLAGSGTSEFSPATQITKLADVWISMAVDKPQISVGDTVSFAISVGNDGPSDVHNIDITLTLPEGLEFVSSNVPTTYHDGKVTGRVGVIVGVNSAGFEIIARATRRGEYTLPAEVTAVVEPDIDSLPSVSLNVDDLNDGIADDDEATVTLKVLGTAVSGRVFNDQDANGIDNSEAGIADVTVVLQDKAANTCRSVRTKGDGSYRFNGVSAGDYTLYEAATADVPSPSVCPPTAADPTHYLSSTANSLNLSVAETDVVNQNFGDVASPSFTLDNSQVTQPNTTVTHPHIFRTEVDGNVTLSLVDENLDPSDLLWQSQLLRDTNCDSKLDKGDTVINGAISLNAGDKLCVLTKVLTPANASSGATQTLSIQSEFTYGDGSIITQTTKQTRTDITKVNAPSSDTVVNGAGKLDLKKSVWNVTRNQSGETALPGETLRYTIQYENIGDGVLDELVVHDALPNFTDLVAGSPACVQTPVELSACTPQLTGNALDWSYVGKLSAGSNGTVSYEVTVQ
jgi:uncharacterized repeat protein (TIGR01451 family)